MTDPTTTPPGGTSDPVGFDEATARPWVAEDGGGKGAWIKGADGHWSALSCGTSDRNADENARLIVEAVNSYDRLTAENASLRAQRDALVEALELARATICAHPADEQVSQSPVVQAIDAALSLAKQENAR